MRPWLLLLTTRADKSNVDTEVLQALLTKYSDNLANCTPFRQASLEKFTIETAAALRAASDTADGLLAVFLTGLCKWFLGLALAHQPPTLVELRSVIGYRVNRDAEHEDLISLAFRFTPTFVPAADPIGLANQQVAAPSECNLATRALKRVARRVDADKLLVEVDGLRQEMIDATAALLGLARYDEQAYRVWVQEF
jgi:hypothetical protein